MALTDLNGAEILIHVCDVFDLWDRQTFTEIKTRAGDKLKVKQTYTEVLNAICKAKGGE